MRSPAARLAVPVTPSPALPRWGWLVLLCLAITGCAISIAAWRYSLATEHEAARVRFERSVQDVSGELNRRLDQAVRLIRSTAALFAASDDVTRDEWSTFVETQKLTESIPGMLGLGYAPLLPAGAVPATVMGARRDGLSGYHVWPASRRDRYAPVLYRCPMDDTARSVLGFDLLADADRRAALDRAVDTGAPALAVDARPAASARPGQASPPGSLLVMPIYGKDAGTLHDATSRRAAVRGWAYVPLDLPAFVAAIEATQHNELSLALWEQAPGGMVRELYASASPAPGRPSQTAVRAFGFAGRQWSLKVSSRPAFDANQPPSRAGMILSGGLLVTMLVTLLVAALLAMRGRAIALAARLSAAHRASEARVRTVLHNAAEGIVTIDEHGRVLSANPVARALLGLPPLDDRSGDPAEQHLPAALGVDVSEIARHLAAEGTESAAGRQWRREVVLRHDGDGREATLLLAASEVRLDDDSRCFVLLLSDVTELQSARQRADEAHRLNETILANAPFCVIATDKGGRIRSINPSGERLLGYAPGELVGRDATRTVLLADELAAHAARLSAELGQPVTPAAVLGVRAMRGQRDELECTYVRKDGTHVPVVLALAPLLDAQGELTGFLGIAYDITERKRSEAYIRHMAHHDELTGLPNRTLLQERAALAIDGSPPAGNNKCMGVLLIDLDRFKQINDSLGHHAGDVVLCTVAARLKHCVRSSDTVARMGGDEFVILLPNIESPQQAERVAAKLLNAMVEPTQAGPHRLTVTPSIGIACYPGDGDDLATLLRNADAAMYHSKSGGRNGYTLYTPQMHTASARRLELEGDLRQALERDELTLHYQPLVSLDDGQVVGVEALLRWTHPVRGSISPVDFIPIAEDTGLIVPIGEWVLRTACMDMKRLMQRTGQRLKVAVNLSPRQLRTTNLTTVIADALSRAGWAAEDLELEITESMVIDNPDASIAAMQRLRAMGVGMAIDDFGTGYSSLSYLTRFPVAKLKLDRSFVRGLPHNERDAAIATSVVAMGHGLKLQVLAEGVETEAQMQFLRQLGCEMGQGWLFAKPMPLDALVRHLQSERPAPLPLAAA